MCTGSVYKYISRKAPDYINVFLPLSLSSGGFRERKLFQLAQNRLHQFLFIPIALLQHREDSLFVGFPEPVKRDDVTISRNDKKWLSAGIPATYFSRTMMAR